MDAEPEPIPDDHDDIFTQGGGDGSFIGDDVEGLLATYPLSDS